MQNKNANLIAHCQGGTSDKIYIAAIRRNPDGSWTVVGKWGKRGRALSIQTKGTYLTLETAWCMAAELFRTKLAKGYCNIEDENYDGCVTRESLREYLENDVDFQSYENDEEPTKIMKPRKKRAKRSPKNEIVVVCLNNRGMDDLFDQGEEYLARACEENGKIYVADVYGKWQTCLVSRFKVKKEDA